jgi:hypothetical protein
MSGRDYAAELRAVIDSEYQDGDAAPIVAARIVDKLRATDPDLLSGWLDAHAMSLLCEEIGRLDRSQRSHARAVASRGAFSQAIRDGDVAGFLETRYVVDEAKTRLPLSKMTGEHLRYVASGYLATANAARLEAAFFRALAKKVGSGVVADHFTEERIHSLRRSIVGEAA